MTLFHVFFCIYSSLLKAELLKRIDPSSKKGAVKNKMDLFQVSNGTFENWAYTVHLFCVLLCSDTMQHNVASFWTWAQVELFILTLSECSLLDFWIWKPHINTSFWAKTLLKQLRVPDLIFLRWLWNENQPGNKRALLHWSEPKCTMSRRFNINLPCSAVGSLV